MIARQLGLATLAALALACSGGGGGGGGGGPQTPPANPTATADAQAVLSDAQMTAAVTALGVGVALNQVDPANFPDPAPGLVTAVSGGGPAGGILRLDFGSGVVINNGLYTGTYILEYVPSGGTVILSLIPSGLDPGTTAQNAARTSSRVEGSVGANLNINGRVASGVIGGALFLGPRANPRFSDTRDSLNLAYDGATGVASFDGSLAIDDPILGPFTATFTGVTQSITGQNPAIDSGVISLDSGPNGISADFSFDAPNAGLLTIQPGNLSLRFQL